MRPGSRTVVVLLGALMLGACDDRAAEPPEWVRATAPDAEALVLRWLTCEECTEGELDDLLGEGPTVVPILGRVLEEGPDSAVLEAHRAHLESRWAALADAAAADSERSMPVGEERFLALFTDSFRTLQRTRAAWALGRVGGPDARDALEAALASSPPEAVAAAIRAALDSM